MKQHRLLLPLLILLLIFVACRREWLATDEDYTGYGWTLYQDGRYKESNFWFQNAIDENKNYKDGYNGMGWSETKMSVDNTEPYLDNAIKHFRIGLQKDPNPRSLHNVDFDTVSYTHLTLPTICSV